MGRDVRFIVFNAEKRLGGELRALLQSYEGVKIVAQVEDDPALLLQAVKRFPIDILLVNLDPNPQSILPILSDLRTMAPSVAIFATSQSSDGPLILQTMRVGVREFLPQPIDSPALKEAIDKITTQRVNSVKLGTLITVMGSAGGVGATVVATNLATELAAIAKGAVTVVDLDYRFGQVATLLDVEPTYTITDLCNTNEQLEAQVIERALVKHSSGLQVLSRPPTFALADTITAASCVGLLSSLLQFNEYVVADGPTRSDLGAKSILDLSDVNLLIVQLLVPTARNASRILGELRESGYDLERIKLICNRTEMESPALSKQDLTEALGIRQFAGIPDDWATVSGAVNLGETLLTHSPKSRVRHAIREIAERLHGPVAETDDKDTSKRGLIGRIFAGA